MPRSVTAELAERREIAERVFELSFALVDPPCLAFKAGQFATLAVGRDASGAPLRRSYSIASRSDEPLLRFLTRLIPGGPASEYFLRLTPGDRVAMTGPHGFFVLDARHAGDVVFAATGTGIAPVLPMLAELADRADEPGRRIVYWGLRAEADVFLRDEIATACAAAGADLRLYLSAAAPSWTGRRGRITADVLAAQADLVAPTFYLVGNGAMIDEVKRGLVAAGVDRKRQIRTEAFFD